MGSADDLGITNVGLFTSGMEASTSVKAYFRLYFPGGLLPSMSNCTRFSVIY